jgi:hypothetical protein
MNTFYFAFSFMMNPQENSRVFLPLLNPKSDDI